jgi:hypothetical protein
MPNHLLGSASHSGPPQDNWNERMLIFYALRGRLNIVTLTTDARMVQVADILLHFLTESNWQ